VNINFRTVLFVWLAAWLFYFGAMEGFGGAAQFPPSVEHPIGTMVVCLDFAVFAFGCCVASAPPSAELSWQPRKPRATLIPV
jgi:hypothetical protein